MSALVFVGAYDPNQPRDERGRWTDGDFIRTLAFDPNQPRDEAGRWVETGAERKYPDYVSDALGQFVADAATAMPRLNLTERDVRYTTLPRDAVYRGDSVGGLAVRTAIPNTDSISAAFYDGEYEELPGLRAVDIASLGLEPYRAKDDQDRVADLAERIRESGEIAPLIVVHNKKEGSYVLEGNHRARALQRLGIAQAPALVIVEYPSDEELRGLVSFVGTEELRSAAGPSRYRLSKFAAEHAAELMKGTRREREAVRREVRKALRNGEGPEGIADRLIEEIDRTPEEIDRIAQTEYVIARTGATLEQLEIDDAEAKEWVLGPGEEGCPICQALDGQVVGLDEMFEHAGEVFDGPPAHPRCKCGIRASSAVLARAAVRFVGAYDPNQPRDERGRWTSVSATPELLSIAFKDSEKRTLPRADMESDVYGVVAGSERRLDYALNRFDRDRAEGSTNPYGYSEDTVKEQWAATREHLRKTYGDHLILFRADAPEKNHSEKTRTVYMGGRGLVRKFATNGRKMRPYRVHVDDVLAVFVPNDPTDRKQPYYEFIVRRPKSGLVRHLAAPPDGPGPENNAGAAEETCAIMGPPSPARPDGAARGADRVALIGAWDENDHPRDERGRFILKSSTRRAWEGAPTGGRKKLSKLETGALGEALAAAYLRGAKSVNVGRNNAPVDLIKGSTAYEVKTGLASNSPSAQKWRATIGQPGKKETSWLRRASAAAKARWNARKQRMIMERKERALQELSRELGRPVKAKTLALIVDPDNRRVDVHIFDGFHARISWGSDLARGGYRGSFAY